MQDSAPTLADILAARRRIAGTAVVTPLLRSALTGIDEPPLWLKLETMQPTGAFKLRGAANAISQLPVEARERGVVCCSTGNHGRGVAFAARKLGVPATVCLSSLVPDVKRDAVAALGARVVQEGQSQDEAQLRATALVESEGLTEVPPFDHPHVIAGQATIGLEILSERPEIDCIAIPLSGGGLAGGIALAARIIKPGIRIVGVSMTRGPAMAESIAAGHPVDVVEVPTLADSLGGGIGLGNRLTFSLCRDLIDDIVLVDEAEIYRGMRALLLRERLVAEGGASVVHAAILAGKLAIDRPTAAIISGNNVAPETITAVAAGAPAHLADGTEIVG